MKQFPQWLQANPGIPESLNQRLSSYALAACATGVCCLALALPAKAEIVYTPADITLHNGSLPIDLDADGIADFTLRDHIKEGYFKSERLLRLIGNVGASVAVSGPYGGALGAYAAALVAGSNIGSGRAFAPVNPQNAKMASVGYTCVTSSFCNDFVHGPWKRVRDGYLGLKFESGGELHYGWARLNVTYTNRAGGHSTIIAKLTGYAHETTPGQAIVAGQTETPSASAPDALITPGTLGALARGTRGR